MSTVRPTRSTRLFANILALGVASLTLTAILAPQTVLAQPGQGGGRGRGPGMGGGPGGGMFGGMRDGASRISERQFKTYADLLKLTDDQRDAADALREGFNKELELQDRDMQKKREDAMAKFRDSQDPAVWDDLRTQMEKSRDNRKKAEATFLDDVKALLTPDQLVAWPKVERAHRRQSTISNGRLSGERVDLVTAVDDLKLSDADRAKIAPLLEEYQDELDRELIRRNKKQEELQGRMREVFQNRDPEAGQKMLEEGRAASVKVRDLNRKYARQMEEALSEPKKAEFASWFKRQSFPRVYREPHAAKEIKAALDFKDLDPAQRESLAALRDSFSRDLDNANDKLAAATERQEMEFNVQRMMNRFAGGGDDQDDSTADLRRQRRELERAASDSLRKILKPEQADRLPKPDPDADDIDRRPGNRGINNRARNIPRDRT
jgi:Spy/CpxP family protein refolding chaperone